MRHLNLRKILLIAILFLFLPSLSLADTVFAVSGTLTLISSSAPVGSFSGTFVINPVTGRLSNWSIAMPSLTGPAGVVGAFTFTPANSTTSVGGPSFQDGSYTLFFHPKSPNSNNLHLAVACLAGQSTPCLNVVSGNPLMSSSRESEYFTGDRQQQNIFLISGEITPTGEVTPAVTPEPSAIILLGSGLAGILAFRHKILL